MGDHASPKRPAQPARPAAAGPLRNCNIKPPTPNTLAAADTGAVDMSVLAGHVIGGRYVSARACVRWWCNGGGGGDVMAFVVALWLWYIFDDNVDDAL